MTPTPTFQTNPNKEFLRSTFDTPLIAAWSNRVGKKLRYFGLPGPEMLDIIAWQEHLENFTTIEREENAQHLLLLRANVKDVEHRLHSLYGEFDQIIITGRDRYQHSPRWPFDLINLDFYGGLLYQDLNRPKALKKVIQNQGNHEHGFLLVLSYHLRDGDVTKEKASFLDDFEALLTRDVGKRSDIANTLSWYRSATTPDAARQSLYVNTLLRDEGEVAHFKVRCRPPIVYSGTGGAKMIHVVTEFEHRKSAHRATSAQSLIDLVNLGYLEVREGALVEPVTIPRIT